MAAKTKTYRERGTDIPDRKMGMLSIDRAAAKQRVEQADSVDIFELDGETYSMLAVERAEIGLEYLAIQESEGGDAAALYLITETLGRDAFDALRSVEGLSGQDWEGVLARIQAIVLPKARTAGRA